VTAIKTVFFNMSTARASKELAAIATLTITSTDSIGAIHLAVDGAVVVPSASAVEGKVVIYSTAVGDMVLNGTALTPAAESLTPQTALQQAASGVFHNTGERPAQQDLRFSARPSALFPTILTRFFPGPILGRPAALGHLHQRPVRRERRLLLRLRAQ
jgi:hypothetical protein